MCCSNGDENLKTKYCAKSYTIKILLNQNDLQRRKTKLLIKYVAAKKFFEDIIIPRIDNTKIEEITCENAH